MKLRFFVAAPILSALAVTLPAEDARACGGCFIQQQQSTVVTGHRMVLSVSPDQSVLWDQIKYTGDPSEFAWVLPVRAGAVIETSSDAWFETLDAATATTILSPQVNCSSGGGPGCGAFSTSLSDSAGGVRGVDQGGGGVTVLHEGTVGPYETVTLASTEPGALNKWLTDHGYNVDEGTQPVIDAYVKEQFDFIALRLQPGKGVRQMKPVRVLTQGMSAELPLRMVAAGTGANVAISLFTISEARFAADNFDNSIVPKQLLLWDFDAQSSNYAELRVGALSQNHGEVFLTPYAAHGSLLSPVKSSVASPFGDGSLQYNPGDNTALPASTIAEAYIRRGIANGEAQNNACLGAFDMIASSGSKVVNPCPFGKGPDDAACTTPSDAEIDSRTLACGALDDIAVALRGLHPKDVWLTRLDADLPRAALAKDLLLKPADKQLPIDNWIRVEASVGDPCPSAVPPAILGSDRPRRGPWVGFALATLAALALARRTARLRFA
jgi:hypothetical protein